MKTPTQERPDDHLINYLHDQFPETIGHLPLYHKVKAIYDLGKSDARAELESENKALREDCDHFKKQAGEQRHLKLEAQKQTEALREQVEIQREQLNRMMEARDAEKLLREKAEAACAEMRFVLCECECPCGDHVFNPTCQCRYCNAISSYAGKGWLPPDRRKAMEEILDTVEHDKIHYGLCDSDCPRCRWDKLKSLTPL